MNRWERAWMVGISFIAGLALVISCAGIALSQELDPRVVLAHDQVLFERLNQAQWEIARLRVEHEKLTRLVEELKKQIPEVKEPK